MARPTNRLSARAVATATTPGYTADGGGLYLLVAAGGTKSWVLRYQLRGRRREMGLGPTSAVPLALARQRAAEARTQLALGIDPLEARNASRAPGKTFGECADAFIADQAAGWRNGAQAAQWTQSLRDYGPRRELPIADVDTDAVLERIAPIWSTKTETASRVRARVERVLDWAKVKKLREGENPARWRGHLDKLLPKPSKVAKKKHHAAMPFRDLPAFWTRLVDRPGKAREALQFAILTVARTEEVVGAPWSEFDLEAGLWTIPKERMKTGVEHVVPLVPAAVAMLKDRPRTKEPPFKLSENTMLYLVQKEPPKGFGLPYTVHGFRSTFRDWVSEETDFAGEIAEKALAHVIKNEAEAAYRRGALLRKRRELMEAWTAYVTSTPSTAR